jgi:hypothetical protein
MGHTDLNRQSSRHRANSNAAVVTASTYKQETAYRCATDDEEELSDVDESHESTAAYITMMPIEQLDINHSDLAGRFPYQSTKGNCYLLVSNYHGYIHLEPINSTNEASYVKAYRATLDYSAKHACREQTTRLVDSLSASSRNKTSI